MKQSLEELFRQAVAHVADNGETETSARFCLGQARRAEEMALLHDGDLPEVPAAYRAAARRWLRKSLAYSRGSLEAMELEATS